MTILRTLLTLSVLAFTVTSARSLELTRAPGEYRRLTVEINDRLSGVTLTCSYGSFYDSSNANTEPRIEYREGEEREKRTAALDKKDVLALHSLADKVLKSYSLEDSKDLEKVMENAMPNQLIFSVNGVETSVSFGFNPADASRVQPALDCFFWMLAKTPASIQAKVKPYWQEALRTAKPPESRPDTNSPPGKK